jgi:deuterolysin
MHDLGAGGTYDIVSNGAVSYAEADSTTLAGVVPFFSNIISAQVDGVQARAARTAFLDRRTVVQSTCKGTRKDTVTTAISNCQAWATQAQAAAASGSADKLVEYFKSSSSSVRSTVSGVFQKEASECGSTTSGVSKTYCSDPYGACDAGVLAYTLPSQSYIAYCDLFFSALPAVTSTCHNQDQAGTTVHETTHLTQIKGTSDYGVYGYTSVQGLTAAQNLNHADTYALYAQGETLHSSSIIICN